MAFALISSSSRARTRNSRRTPELASRRSRGPTTAVPKESLLETLSSFERMGRSRSLSPGATRVRPPILSKETGTPSIPPRVPTGSRSMGIASFSTMASSALRRQTECQEIVCSAGVRGSLGGG